MNNKYKIEKHTISEALDTIDNFITSIEKFKSKYKNYDYNVDLSFSDDIWYVELDIKNEKTNPQRLQSTSNTHGVL